MTEPMTTGELISQFRKAGIYPKLKKDGGLRVSASTDDLTSERRNELREQLQEAAPAIRAYLVRQEWVTDRICDWCIEAEANNPNGIDWNLHSELELKLLQLYEDYQNAPIGTAEEELAWRSRIDAMLVDYITERKKGSHDDASQKALVGEAAT